VSWGRLALTTPIAAWVARWRKAADEARWAALDPNAVC
jgi:hypothetical protein